MPATARRTIALCALLPVLTACREQGPTQPVAQEASAIGGPASVPPHAVWVTAGGNVAPRLIQLDGSTGQVRLSLPQPDQIESMDVDPATGDVWLVTINGLNSLMRRYSDTGALLLEHQFGTQSQLIGVDPVTGDAWAGAVFELTRFSPSGVALASFAGVRVPDFDLVVDPNDRSVWYIDIGQSDPSPPRVVHIDQDGTLLSNTTTFTGDFATGLDIDLRDGSVWASVLFMNRLEKIDPAGSVVASVAIHRPGTVAVDSDDGSVWTSTRFDSPTLRKYDENGVLLFSLPGYSDVGVRGIALVPEDGSVWVISHDDLGVTSLVDHLDSSGNLLLHISGEDFAPGLSHTIRFIAPGPFPVTLMQIELLIGAVEELVDDGTLRAGQGGSLIRKLESATQQNVATAIGALRAFIIQVQGFMKGMDPILTSDQGQALIDAAEAIIDGLTA